VLGQDTKENIMGTITMTNNLRVMIASRTLRAHALASAAKWEAQSSAASHLMGIVGDMEQVIAEASKEKLLRDKVRLVSDNEFEYSLTALCEALETLTSNWLSGTIKNHYNSLACWFHTLESARTFAEWEECRENFVRSRNDFRKHWKIITRHSADLITYFNTLAESYRRDIVRRNKRLFKAVATPKRIRKLRAGVFISAWYQAPEVKLTFKQWSEIVEPFIPEEYN
jgi:hypothetical protein